jgi:hypothetical protein
MIPRSAKMKKRGCEDSKFRALCKYARGALKHLLPSGLLSLYCHLLALKWCPTFCPSILSNSGGHIVKRGALRAPLLITSCGQRRAGARLVSRLRSCGRLLWGVTPSAAAQKLLRVCRWSVSPELLNEHLRPALSPAGTCCTRTASSFFAVSDFERRGRRIGPLHVSPCPMS